MVAEFRQLQDDIALRLTIVAAAYFDEPQKWGAQLDLIKASGASYAGNGNWSLVVRGTQLSGEHLHPLWQAVHKYHTSVHVTAIRGV